MTAQAAVKKSPAPAAKTDNPKPARKRRLRAAMSAAKARWIAAFFAGS